MAGLKQYYKQYSLEMGFREAASRAERYNRVNRLDMHRQTKTTYLTKGLHTPSRFAKAEIATPRHWRDNAFWDMPAITEPMKMNLLKSRRGTKN